MYNGIKYHNAEAAFQAQKTHNRELQEKYFANVAANIAKRNGSKRSNLFVLRNDWEEVKDNIMYEIVKAKFVQNPELAEKLLATGEAKLIEGNHWHDNYWGDCSCEKCKKISGKNQLGITLMRVRKELKTL